jgi:LPXTG-motif cell wall-anchored protein
MAAIGVLSPLAVVAQEQTSGAQTQLGGVTSTTSPAVSGAVTRTAPAAVTTAPTSAQTRPIVLPNTGTGPGDDASNVWALALGAGLVALGGGAYIHRRWSRSRVAD